MKAMAELRRDFVGLEVLNDWLGDGCETVPQGQAESRAALCIACPHNVAPNWWGRHAKDPIAQAIKRHLEAKNALRLTVPNEYKLAMCQVCGCCTQLKIWTPIEYIDEYTPLDKYLEYPADGKCWVRTEIDQRKL